MPPDLLHSPSEHSTGYPRPFSKFGIQAWLEQNPPLPSGSEPFSGSGVLSASEGGLSALGASSGSGVSSGGLGDGAGSGGGVVSVVGGAFAAGCSSVLVVAVFAQPEKATATTASATTPQAFMPSPSVENFR
jgi:hypothetical protein